MIIMIYKEDDQDGLGGGYTFYLEDGTQVPRGFTPKTGIEASERFLKLLNEHKHIIVPLIYEYNRARDWNIINRGRSKNWPIFSQLDKMLNKLQKMAGIIDT